MNNSNLTKSIIIIVSIVLVSLILVACHANTDSNEPYLVVKDSWFDDFQIMDDNVVFFCHLAIQNPRDHNITIRIDGDFSKDFASGLVTEETLQAVSKEDSTVTQFSVHPGMTQLDVAFVGTHGTYDYKQDRFLPVIEISTVP